MDIEDTLVKQALEMRQFSYAPYSEFRVGAALLGTNHKIYTGCNVENAGYSATNCAERTAFFKAISEGCHEFEAIAIAGGRDDIPQEYCPPCGVCRQVMMEFCKPDFKILLVKSEIQIQRITLEELFPMGFGPEKVKK